MQSFMKTVVTDMMPNRIEEMGFKGILKLAARSLDNRDFLSWPMDRFDPDNMRTELQHIVTIHITCCICNMTPNINNILMPLLQQYSFTSKHTDTITDVNT
jgi:hypothetical protein